MACNVAVWDRIIRIIFGILLLIWTVAGGPFWGLIGIIPIATGSWGFCPFYALAKIRTNKQPEVQNFDDE